MANFCLLPEKVNEFRKALKEKEITIPQLLNMTSEARTTLLKQYAGDNAGQVNTLFEEKLVLKNRMLGIKNWASKVGEIGKYSPEGKVKLAQAVSEYRAAQQKRIFSPKENEAFLANLAEKQLGTAITQEEAKNVFELSGQVDELKKNFDGKKWTDKKAKANYGAAKVLYENYVADLKGENVPLKEQIKGRLTEFKNTANQNKAKAVLDLSKDALKTISDNSIAVVASVDNSFLGRQGLKTLLTHPTAWWPGAKNSFVDFVKTLGGQETMDALMADIYSDPEYINGEYQKAGILAKTEEQFPTSLPERVPYIGKVFKASEVAFKGSGIRMRTQLYKLLADNAKAQGVEMNDIQIKDIGTGINSLTARGKGRLTENELTRLVLWSPRMLKASYDTLTAHTFGAGLETSFARKEAWKNLAKIIGVLGTILLIAKAIKKDSADLNPLSSDFGNITVADTKVSRIMGILADFVGVSSNTYNGKTRFNVTGGMNTLVTFVSRQIAGKTKNSTTGVTTKLSSDFGASSRFDVFINFLSGKTTPIVGAGIDAAKGTDFQGNKPTIGSTVEKITVPISIQNILNLNKKSGGIDGVDWSQNPGKELQAFKNKVGDAKFKEANGKYNQQFNQWIKDLQNKSDFKTLSDEDQQAVITNKKDEIKNSIFKQYGFKYKAPSSVTKKKLPKF